MGYDPVERHKAIEKLVVKGGSNGQLRKYYRFRPAKWYGGIFTADCVGCGLQCKFCWLSDRALYRPMEVGSYYPASAVAERLVEGARKRGYSQARLSGGEPTIGRRHLLDLLGRLEGCGLTFILETNGILLGHDESYAKALSKYPFVHVRVSLKGCDEKEFSALTGADPGGFSLQLKALENLVEAKVDCHPAVMISFSAESSLKGLLKRLEAIEPKLAEELEIEELILYPHVVERLKRFKLSYFTGYAPNSLPRTLI